MKKGKKIAIAVVLAIIVIVVIFTIYKKNQEPGKRVTSVCYVSDEIYDTLDTFFYFRRDPSTKPDEYNKYVLKEIPEGYEYYGKIDKYDPYLFADFEFDGDYENLSTNDPYCMNLNVYRKEADPSYIYIELDQGIFTKLEIIRPMGIEEYYE